MRIAVAGRSPQAEWGVAIRDQQEGVRENTQRPAKYADYEVKHWTRVVAGQENGESRSDQDRYG